MVDSLYPISSSCSYPVFCVEVSLPSLSQYLRFSPNERNIDCGKVRLAIKCMQLRSTLKCWVWYAIKVYTKVTTLDFKRLIMASGFTDYRHSFSMQDALLSTYSMP